jgi:predicted chitinase
LLGGTVATGVARLWGKRAVREYVSGRDADENKWYFTSQAQSNLGGKDNFVVCEISDNTALEQRGVVVVVPSLLHSFSLEALV